VPESELGANRRERALNAYQQALDFIRESMMTIDSPAQLNVRKAKRTVQKLVDLSYEEGNGFSLAGMASIKAHDDYTFNHMVNVCVLAIAFGQRLGLKRHSLAQLGLSALYHDMGKLHIPLDVLNKGNGFSEEEWAVMGNHTIYAARTLFPLIVVDRTTVNRILTSLQHHLRYDGTGYPQLRIRRKQSLYARITAIVDTFDAMTTKRIYQRQYLPDEAIAVMHQGASTRYDPLLVKAFINCMGIYPVGSTVVLRSGELAVVVESNPDADHLHQPRIRVVTDSGHANVPSFLVDLSQPGEEPRAILHCVDPEEFGITSAHYAF
ncbi:MAG TPA: HD domain-containing phosphohydrolase, partial [Vicinamibacteria bacterium]|nr:HD domain-containing phosphohydrolase [Vicinamibacteria bacterium]